MPTQKARGRPAHEDVLTPAEWRTVNAIRHGLTNRQIAERRGVSVATVKYHVSNALAKLGFSSRRELRHWLGVAKDSPADATASSGTPDTGFGAIGQVARTVGDIDVAQRFYAEIVGLRPLYAFGDMAFFDCGGVRLMLSRSDSPAQESILYFRTPDIHGAYRRLLAAGVEFVAVPHLIHRHPNGIEEWMAFFLDPERRPLAIMAQYAPRIEDRD